MTKKYLLCAILVSLLALSIACGSKAEVEYVGGADLAISDNQDEDPVGESESVLDVNDLEEADVEQTKDYDWSHGTAGYIGNRTIVLSIFADDIDYAWGDDEESSDTINKQLYNLALACEWLAESVSNYGVTADFVYDWRNNDDLRVDLSIPYNVFDVELETLIWEAIEKNVDTLGLLKKYEAENIIYVIFANVPKDWKATSYTWIYENDKKPYEYSQIYINDVYGEVCPTVIAHELLHTFGAHDLYVADGGTYGATEEYVNYLRDTGSKDIMYKTTSEDGRYVYDKIDRVLTDIDAYYIGILDSCEDIEKYGMDISEYE